MNRDELTSVNNENEIEIDFGLVIKRLLKYWKMIVVSAIVCGLLSFVVSAFFITEMFDSTGRIYIKPENESTGTVDSSTIDVTNKMVNNYIYMLKGDIIIESVAKQLDGQVDDPIKEDELKNLIEVTAEPDSAVITIKATTYDPVLSKEIVDRMISVFFAQIEKELDITNTMIIDHPKKAKAPVSPSVPKNTVLGIILGGFLATAAAAFMIIFDKNLKTKREAEEYLGLPVLAEIREWS